MTTTNPHPDVRIHQLGEGYSLRPDGPLPDGRGVFDGVDGWTLDWVVEFHGFDEDGRACSTVSASTSISAALNFEELLDERSGAARPIPGLVMARLRQLFEGLQDRGLA